MLAVEVLNAVKFYEQQTSYLSNRLASAPFAVADPHSLEQGVAERLRVELKKAERRLGAMQQARDAIAGRPQPTAAPSQPESAVPAEEEDDDLAPYDDEPEDVDSALAEESLIGSGESDCDSVDSAAEDDA
jgi:hypothetical protein